MELWCRAKANGKIEQQRRDAGQWRATPPPPTSPSATCRSAFHPSPTRAATPRSQSHLHSRRGANVINRNSLASIADRTCIPATNSSQSISARGLNFLAVRQWVKTRRRNNRALKGMDGNVLDPARKIEPLEAVASDDANAFLVSFERNQRIWRYHSYGSAGPLTSIAFDVGTTPPWRYATAKAATMEWRRWRWSTRRTSWPSAKASANTIYIPPKSPAFLFDLTATPPSALRFDYRLNGGLLPTDLRGFRQTLIVAASSLLSATTRRSSATTYGAAHHAVGARSCRDNGRLLEADLLAELLPNLHNVDNFEGLAIVPNRLTPDTAATAFMVSDDNANLPAHPSHELGCRSISPTPRLHRRRCP